MKTIGLKHLFCSLITFLLAYNSNAQTWQLVGSLEFVAQYSSVSNITFNSHNIPYIAYSDGASQWKASALQFVDTAWQFVGTEGFSDTTVFDVCIAIGKNDTPYVAYLDGANIDSVTVKKFDGTNWVTVGNRGFSGANMTNLSFAIDNNGTPYVAYSDAIVAGKCSVMKYEGNAWLYVGIRGFSDGQAGVQSIAIDNNGTPHVMFVDYAHFYKATVMKFYDSAWVDVGFAGFTDTSVSTSSMVLDTSGMPYIAYIRSIPNDSKYTLNVLKYNDTAWVPVGEPNFSPGNAAYPAIAFNKSGVPYVSYSIDTDLTNQPPESVSVMKFDGTNWIYVGNEGFSDCYTGGTSIAIDSGGTPYVAYEVDNTYKFLVQEYAPLTGITGETINVGFEIYPNPTNNKLEIEIQNPASSSLQITVMDVSGQTLMHQTINPAIKNELDVSALPAGLYFIQLQDDQQSVVRKFVKE